LIKPVGTKTTAKGPSTCCEKDAEHDGRATARIDAAEIVDGSFRSIEVVFYNYYGIWLDVL